jgi:MoaA/NifB/PqqE/SkfB family radical SAM enzyme
LNLAITQNCNLDCPYCFAPNGESKDPELRMSEEDYDFAIKFFKRSNHRVFKIFGGEPTIHPKFKEFYEKVVYDPFFDKVVLFTNAAFNEGILDVFLSVPEELQKKMIFTINYNNEDVTENYAETIDRNILALTEKTKARVVLGLNLYDPEQDTSHFFDMIEKVPKGRIYKARWAITSPGDPDENKLDQDIVPSDWETGLNHHETMLPVAADFILECKKAGIKEFVTDCTPFLPCVMEDDDLRKIVKVAPEVLERQKCKVALDVEYDLTITRCYSTAALTNVNVRDFTTLGDAVDFFQHTVDRHRFAVHKDDCKECTARLSSTCQGGCMGYQLDMLNQRQITACENCKNKCRFYGTGAIPGTEHLGNYQNTRPPKEEDLGQGYRCF